MFGITAILKIGLKRILIVFTIVESSFSDGNINMKVRLELMTKPVVFGENVTIACMIHDNSEIQCDKINRLWEGGPLNRVLLINGVSVDQTKYVETIDNPCEKFSIIIKSFDLSDVNCSYRCSYGFESSRKELQLDNASFIAKPDLNATKVSISKDKSHYNVTVNIAKVYPLPQCYLTFGRHTNDLSITEMSGTSIYKNVTLQQRYSIREICTACRQEIPMNLSCSLNKVIVIQHSESINCSDNCMYSFNSKTPADSRLVLYPIIGILTAILIVNAVVYYCRKRPLTCVIDKDDGVETTMEKTSLEDIHHLDRKTAKHPNTTKLKDTLYPKSTKQYGWKRRHKRLITKHWSQKYVCNVDHKEIKEKISLTDIDYMDGDKSINPNTKNEKTKSGDNKRIDCNKALFQDTINEMTSLRDTDTMRCSTKTSDNYSTKNHTALYPEITVKRTSETDNLKTSFNLIIGKNV